MTIESVKTAVEKFLKDIEDEGLLKKSPDPNLGRIQQEAQHRAQLEVLASSARIRIDIFQNKSISQGQRFIPENEYRSLRNLYVIYSMLANAEELKTYLKLILNPDLINTDITELGKFMSSIYDKLGYASTLREEMNNKLFVNLRNALSHLDYDVTINGLTYRNKDGTSITLTNDDLVVMLNEYNEIVKGFNVYIKKIASKLQNDSSSQDKNQQDSAQQS